MSIESKVRGVGSLAVAVALVAACSSSTPDDAGNSTTDTGSPSSTSAEPTDPDPAETDPPTSIEPTEAGPDQNRILITDPGVEPRAVLAISSASAHSLLIDATESGSTTFDGATTATAASAEYRLDVVVEPPADDGRITVLIAPTLQSISSDTTSADLLSSDVLGEWIWTLDEHGAIRSAENADPHVSISAATGELLSIPTLVLATPAAPVGVGASWQQPTRGSSDGMMTVTIDAMSDDDIDVTITIEGVGETGTLSVESSGRYDRASLLAIDVVSEMTVIVDSEVQVDGTAQPLAGERRSSRSITVTA